MRRRRRATSRSRRERSRRGCARLHLRSRDTVTSFHRLELTRASPVVSGQVAKQSAVSGRSDHPHECFYSPVCCPIRREAEVEGLGTDRQEREACFFANETKTDPGIRVARANHLGDATVVPGDVTWNAIVSEDRLQALTRSGPRFSSNPPKARRRNGPHGCESAVTVEGNSFFPARNSQEFVSGSEAFLDRGRVASVFVHGAQVDPCDMHQSLSQEDQCRGARTRENDDSHLLLSSSLGYEESGGRIAPCKHESPLRIRIRIQSGG